MRLITMSVRSSNRGKVEMNIQAGSSVYHKPTGEEWFILGVSGDRVCVGGYPPTIAYIADCEVLPEPIKELSESELDYRRKEFGEGWQ
ncbi:hypothetical protein [Pantanalinema sp. GBBB05]|uniref:hypothetical protein n=1 Tax=Pantanalinema sp. GBBB05 TaxID=2604139 RepID=UPI001D317ED7|nr:hypothetical protein [Pantanalinema sp. GBBB05]